MATNYMAKLSEDEKHGMGQRLCTYLGRHIHSIPNMPAPLDTSLAMIEQVYEGPEREAWWALRRMWDGLDSGNTGYSMRMMKQPTTVGVTLEFPDGGKVGLQIPDDVLRVMNVPFWYPVNDRMPVLNPSVVLSAQMCEEFTEWATHSLVVVERVARTWGTIREVINLASTVGQIHRMMPDLIKYVYPTTAKALENQQRRSPLPHGWMDIDRRMVRDAQDHIALCHMLPEAQEERGHNAGVTNFHQRMLSRIIVFGKGGHAYVDSHARSQIGHRTLNGIDMDGNVVKKEGQ